ncbi:MAG: aspartate aminotransferase family protein [Clostridia bacterium]|nr:aspartate aminotransferase family protein [Clostridia bacterium]
MSVLAKEKITYENAQELKSYIFRGDGIKDIEFTTGNGVYLWDSEGKKYIDCAAGTFNLSLGYQNKEVIDAVKDQADKMVHLSSSYLSRPVLELAKKLVEVSPKNLTKVTTKVSSGSTANEGAIKLAQYYTGKREVISFYRSHVGQTIFMQTVSGLSFRRKPFNFSQNNISHIPYPYCYRCHLESEYPKCNYKCVEQIRDYILYGSSGNVSCIIMEPILGNGGNQVPPKEFFHRLKQLCDEEDIVLIFDEIQTGIGRTGKMFAAQYFEVEPNIMSVAKGLGGTGFQIAAILMEEKFNIMEGYLHSFTYGSNVLSCAAGVKTLDMINNDEFFDNVTNCGNFIMERLNKFKEKYEFIGDVRGVGLMIGVEIVKDKQSKEPDSKLTNEIVKRALDHGLLIRTSLYGFGNVFKIRPSLNITLEECEEMMTRLKKVLDEFQR